MSSKLLTATKLPSRKVISPYPDGFRLRATSSPLKKPMTVRVMLAATDMRNLVFIDVELIMSLF